MSLLRLLQTDPYFYVASLQTARLANRRYEPSAPVAAGAPR
jgi:hypothetical protein